MTHLTREHDHACRVEWQGDVCHATIEAWEADRAYDRAARMRGLTWGPCLPTPGGTWKIEGTGPVQ